MLEKYKEWLEDHFEVYSVFILILSFTMLFVAFFSSSLLFKGIACFIYIGICYSPLLLEIMDSFSSIPKVLCKGTQQFTFDFESDFCSECLRYRESKKDSYKRNRHKIRDMLKAYKEKTDVKEAKQLRKMLKTLEENCVPIPRSVERQQMPLLEEALYAFLKLPDSVPKKFRKQMEKDTNEIIHIVLEQLQQVFDSYYDEEAKKIAINKTVVEWLNPEDPFKKN